ncbi:zf-C2HC5-domain-containing protein [Aspergillus ambiguus]|uniref:C2HC5-type zinc finger protein n=1 Tax=Aspergillus ambiguus TaxID=176160 RepID=UPI003CCD64F7
MSDPALLSWGLPRLAQLLPLDEDSLTQILTYAASLSTEDGAEHLKNLLGDSPAAFEFVSSFSARRDRPAPVPNSSSKKTKKTKPPLHSAGPPRRPENFGNVAGGYKKANQEEDYMPSSSRSTTATTATATNQPARETTSPAPSPAPPSKPPPSASGPVISDLLPNVKSKATRSTPRASSGGGAPAKGSPASLTTNNISDLTAAIAALEVSTNPTLRTGQTHKCNCAATLHPLFTPAPNCLRCGKIICSLEGLQPCSFCGAALLSGAEIQDMIRELRAERGQEKMRAHNEGVHAHREGGPASAPGGGGGSKLDAARAHRDKLLNFQAQNARRTRVVDEAADFETPNVASTLWMSPAQRALALKKQQRIMREMEEKARPEWEKKKTVMSLDIKGGRVTRVYQSAGTGESSAAAEEAEEDAREEEIGYDPARKTGGEAFSRNPLLAAGGLVRPVWKGADGQPAEDGARKERKQTWRRVQDDRDDNEQWILDGGLYGYS